jgi:DNA-directed RNA polymerase specialized sigma24 family protein
MDEIEAVADGYEELREHDNKAWIHVRLIDLWRAVNYLSREQQQAVVLCGMMGFSTRQAAPLLEVSHTTVAKRYASGLGAMRMFLNGG